MLFSVGMKTMTGRAAALVLLVVCASVVAVAVLRKDAAPRRGVWFCGDFETGGLEGWSGDLARPGSAEVVTEPVREGRYAVRVTLAPGDVAARKERAELKVADKEIERVHGSHGREMWYGWSLFLPAEYADPPGDQFQILGQWHHRPLDETVPGKRSWVSGAPPLALYLVRHEGRRLLILIGQASPKAPPRHLGGRPVRQGVWTDLVFHMKWSTGSDGFVEAWLDGDPLTTGRMYGPTLYSPVSNYLRLGLYRGKGVFTTNHVYYDAVRLGDSYQAVAP